MVADFKKPLLKFLKRLIQLDWNALFYDGKISSINKVFEHEIDTFTYYNTYSIPIVEEFCLKYNYNISKSSDFNIDINIQNLKIQIECQHTLKI